MEIEAKLAVPDIDTFQRLQAADHLAGFALSAGIKIILKCNLLALFQLQVKVEQIYSLFSILKKKHI